MRGAYGVRVWNNRVQYKFTIRRNLTILRGNSATGKSTLIGLISQYARDGARSGVQMTCARKCVVLTSDYWREKIRDTHDSLIFIDEDGDFVRTKEFAALVQHSDCYFIIVTRATLSFLPYSVEEIYELKNVTRGYGKISRLYTEFQRIYTDSNIRPEKVHTGDNGTVWKPDLVIAEDSNSGYQFFQYLFERIGIPCVSANGNSGIAQIIQKQERHSAILIIADGAAFGPYIEKTLTQSRNWDIVVFLPESFEWLILESGLIDGNEVRKMLEDPASQIESREYFSWERFFTAYLIHATENSYLKYAKKDLNPAYLHTRERRAIAGGLPDVINELTRPELPEGKHAGPAG